MSKNMDAFQDSLGLPNGLQSLTRKARTFDQFNLKQCVRAFLQEMILHLLEEQYIDGKLVAKHLQLSA